MRQFQYMVKIESLHPLVTNLALLFHPYFVEVTHYVTSEIPHKYT